MTTSARRHVGMQHAHTGLGTETRRAEKCTGLAPGWGEQCVHKGWTAEVWVGGWVGVGAGGGARMRLSTSNGRCNRSLSRSLSGASGGGLQVGCHVHCGHRALGLLKPQALLHHLEGLDLVALLQRAGGGTQRWRT